MISESYPPKQKHIHFKAYPNLCQLEKSWELIEHTKSLDLQISILGKMKQFDFDIEANLPSENIKMYWEKLLGDIDNFGSFYNPEIGNVFIVGSLATIFLHKINGKPLAMLSAGPYGIFRGLGVSEVQTTMYLKMLINGSYLLIFRGYKDEVEIFTKILE